MTKEQLLEDLKPFLDDQYNGQPQQIYAKDAIELAKDPKKEDEFLNAAISCLAFDYSRQYWKKAGGLAWQKEIEIKRWYKR